MSVERIATLTAVGVSALALLYTYIDGERDNSRSNDISFSEYASKISRLESNQERLTERLIESTAEVERLEAMLASLPPPTDFDQLDGLLARIADLERRPAAATADIDVSDVADALFENYGDALRGDTGPRGPQGEQGPQGDQGPAGEATGTTTAVALASPEVREQFIFDSEFETKRIGDLQVDLVGCFNGGGSVSCEFQVEALTSDIVEVSFRSIDFQIALETSEWHESNRVRLLNRTATSHSTLRHDFIPNLPVRVFADFQGAETNGSGLPIVEFCTTGCNTKTSWNSVAFSGQ
ncbi:collagen-like protein [Yoonia sp. BS5-3]|uniref:Collagen-like protein n=1 Tax=Yoonia phaeophyticola TaxID=3137369 RepID=A0ABZ2V9Y8_9RHOB